ncbi:MAG: hypothetical protein KatS3mg001_427 [Candidatus Pacearchaeota archaeon]|nr:MAG: hypothetical protein KatS3mg001_427 [Candidatus Pacearchaeota archaeon]
MIKKLVTKEEAERKRKRNQIILGVVLLLVMVLGTIGFAIQSNSGTTDSSSNSLNKIKYKNYEFENRNGLWVLGNFVFSYNPLEIQSFQSYGVGISSFEKYLKKPLYIYSQDETAKNEVYVNLVGLVERVQNACLENEECNDESLPKKTCSDNFIFIKISNETSITEKDNCVFIQGKDREILKLTDEFLFKILKIR